MALAFQKQKKETSYMIFYISGGEMEEALEKVGVTKMNLMLSFFPSSKGKPEKRFLRIYKSRKRKLKRSRK